jgi:hypothetical protein
LRPEALQIQSVCGRIIFDLHGWIGQACLDQWFADFLWDAPVDQLAKGGFSPDEILFRLASFRFGWFLPV